MNERRIRRLEVEHQILRIEQEWEHERRRMTVSEGNGKRYHAPPGYSLAFGIPSIMYGLYLMTRFPPPYVGWGILFGAVFLSMGALVMWAAYDSAAKYARAKGAFEARKKQLEDEIALNGDDGKGDAVR